MLPGPVVAQLLDLLHHCHTFLATNPRAEIALVEYCQPHPEVTAYGIIDQLAWQTLLLRTHLTPTHLTQRPRAGS